MKLLCDVCEGAAASVLCFADAAATCLPCDARVHAANKLASKHQRAPLLSAAATSSAAAACDICQDRAPFFFCLEDRAILCRECDLSLHPAAAVSANHRRFFLTGISVGAGMAKTSSPVDDNHHHDHGDPDHDYKLVAGADNNYHRDDNHTTAVHSKSDKIHNCDKNHSRSCILSTVLSPAPSTSFTKAPNVSDCNSVVDNCKQGEWSNQPRNLNLPANISIRRLSAGSIPFVAPVLSTLSALAQPAAGHGHGATTNRASITAAASDDCDPWTKLAEELLNNLDDQQKEYGSNGTSAKSELKEAKDYNYGVAEVPEMTKPSSTSISAVELWAYEDAWRSSTNKAGEQNGNHNYISSGGVEAWDFDCLFDSTNFSVAVGNDDVSVVPDIIFSANSGGKKKRRKFEV